MTKEQKSEIRLWINLRIMKITEKLNAPENQVPYSEKTILSSQLGVIEEMKGLLEGTLIVKGSKLIPV